MRLAHAVSSIVVLATLAACSLFTDLGSFSGDTAVTDSGAPPPADAAVGDAGVDSDTARVVDAGTDASPYKQAVLEDAPIAYWPFDEAAGDGVARDIVGSKSAKAVGVVAFGVAGVDGTAVSRAAGGGRLEVGDFFDLAGTQPYTIELWAMRNNEGTVFENLLEKRTDAQVGWVVYNYEEPGSGATTMRMEHNGDIAERFIYASVTTPRQMHHYVFVFAPSEPLSTRFRAYVDGVQTNGTCSEGPAADTPSILTIVPSFIGTVDELAIYDHVLAKDRIANHHQLGAK